MKAIDPVPMTRGGRAVAVLLWLLVLFLLSYKLKTIGLPAKRPGYLVGLGLGVMIGLRHAATLWQSGRLTFGRRDEGLVVLLFIATFAYLTLQGAIYSSMIRPLLYSVTTVFVVYQLGLLTAARYGTQEMARIFLLALMTYCVANFALLLVGVLSPDLYNLVQVSPLKSGYGVRPGGFLGDPTHFGALLSVTALLVFVLRDRYSRATLLVFSCFIVVGLALAGSRNAIVSFASGAIAAVVLEKKLTKAVVRVTFIAICVLLAVVAMLMLNQDLVEVLRIAFKFDSPQAYSRLDSWRMALEFFERLPLMEQLLGGGFGYIQGYIGSPYNAFLRFFFDHGLAGMVAMMLSVLMVFVLIVTEEDAMTRKVAGALFFYWLSFSMFLDTFYAEFFHLAEGCFWLAAALVTAPAFVANAGVAQTQYSSGGMTVARPVEHFEA